MLSELNLTSYPNIIHRKSNLKANFYKNCAKCGIVFWHVDPLVNHCGNNDCNNEDVHYKTFKANVNHKPELNETITHFKNYFYNNTARKCVLLDRCATSIKISSTNMNFITAGISTFETLMHETNNLRLKEFNQKLLISAPFCYRFYDKKNVGCTKRHSSGFFMLSLHCFENLENKFSPFWKEEFLEYILGYFLDLGFPLKNIYLHGDKWSDGVSYGPSVEIFVNGVELGNTVFTCYKNNAERTQKFLDVGLGAERINNILAGSAKYTQEIDLDHMRSLILAFKDGIYPCKTGYGFNIRKILEHFFDKNLTSADSIRYLAEPIIEDLKKSNSGDNFDTFFKLFDEISKIEANRYYKYTKQV